MPSLFCRSKTKKVKKDNLAKLMEEASSMMKVAAKAAKTHNRYLRALAEEKELDLSSSSSED